MTKDTKNGGISMQKTFRKELFNQAKAWILEAGGNIRRNINDPMIVNTKSNPHDLVTETDKLTEKFFADRIKEMYPNHLLLGEEGYGDEVSSLDGTVWIIDPIDGTMNFVHLKKDFAISVGIFHNGIGEIGFIYDVMADVLYSAIRGEGACKNDMKLEQLSDKIKLEESIFAFNHDLLCESQQFDRDVIENFLNNIRSARIIGAAALDIANVAEGKLDGFISNGLSPWDVAGGFIILDEVGGVTTRSDGMEVDMLKKGTIVACNQTIHKEAINKFLYNWEGIAQ